MSSLAARRRARGWSQAQLAEIVRVSKRTISRAEQGKLPAAALTMRLIELALSDPMAKPTEKRPGRARGFAVMAPEKQRALASAGGKAAHANGRGRRFTSEEARRAGKKGGLVVAQNKEYMRELARRGGLKRSENLRNKNLTPSQGSPK